MGHKGQTGRSAANGNQKELNHPDSESGDLTDKARVI
jgi:hypothetical protein